MMQHRRLGLVVMDVGGGATSSALDTPGRHAETLLFYALYARRNNLPYLYTHIITAHMYDHRQHKKPPCVTAS